MHVERERGGTGGGREGERTSLYHVDLETMIYRLRVSSALVEDLSLLPNARMPSGSQPPFSLEPHRVAKRRKKTKTKNTPHKLAGLSN